MWNVIDLDTPLAGISFDLYFGTDITPPKYMSDLDETNYPLRELKYNTTYHWYVIPFDETGEGKCSSSVWSFTVNRSVQAPETRYLTPSNGAIISTTSIDLAWEVDDPSGGDLSFNINLGDAEDNLSRIGTTDSNEYLLKNLEYNTTYYWEVIPWSNTVLGRSTSGVWNFTVKRNFVSNNTISWSMDKDLLTVIEGASILSFNLTVNNTGNNVNTININVDDLNISDMLIGKVLFTPTTHLVLPIGGSETVRITVLTSSLVPGEYPLVLLLGHNGAEETISLAVNITEKISDSPPVTPREEGTGGDSKPFPVLYIILIGAVFLISLFFILYRRRKKKRDIGEDVEIDMVTPDVDIVHIPSPGYVNVTSMPHLMQKGRDHGIPQERTYQIKGRSTAPYMTRGSEAPYTDGKTASKPGDFDLSRIQIPGASEMEGITVPQEEGEEKTLSLPPARYLEITEEEQKVPIEEIFLMTPTGILLQHYSLERETGLNEDVLASMLSAVTSFIIDSLSMIGKEDVGGRDLSIDMGDFSVMMAPGDSLNLVAITSRDKKEDVKKQLEKGVDALEDVFGEIMTDWDGDMSKIEGVKPYVESLVKGELDKLINTKLLASREIPERIHLSESGGSTGERMSLPEGSGAEDGPPPGGIEESIGDPLSKEVSDETEGNDTEETPLPPLPDDIWKIPGFAEAPK